MSESPVPEDSEETSTSLEEPQEENPAVAGPPIREMPSPSGEQDANEEPQPESESQPPSNPQLSSEGGIPASQEPGSEPEAPEPSPSPAEMPLLAPQVEINLLNYLLSLTRALPAERQEEFRQSEYLLKIESLKNRLAGHQGFFKDKASLLGEPRTLKGPLPKSKVKNTLSFLTDMAQFYPNPDAEKFSQEKIYKCWKKIPEHHNKENRG